MEIVPASFILHPHCLSLFLMKLHRPQASTCTGPINFPLSLPQFFSFFFFLLLLLLSFIQLFNYHDVALKVLITSDYLVLWIFEDFEWRVEFQLHTFWIGQSWLRDYKFNCWTKQYKTESITTNSRSSENNVKHFSRAPDESQRKKEEKNKTVVE